MLDLFNRSFRQNRCHKTYPIINDISINWPLAYTLKPCGVLHIRIKLHYFPSQHYAILERNPKVSVSVNITYGYYC